MTISHTDLDKLSAQQRRELLTELLRRKEHGRRVAPPPLKADPARRYEPFPLTDVQYAYWLGQQGLFPLGNVATHAYLEFEADGMDVERVERTFNRLVGYHGMLRAVVGADGRQRILERVEPYRIAIDDLRGAEAHTVQSRLLATRATLSHKVHAPDRWPLFEIRATVFGAVRVRLHISLSLLILDAWSIRILLTQWFALYDHPKLPLPALQVSFRDYVLAEEATRSSEEYRRAEAYWRNRLSDLPPGPDLPLAADPREVERPRFARVSQTIDEERWARLKTAARRANLTPSGLLLAAFGSVLRRWSQNPRFLINATVFNRQPWHPEIDYMLGDFTSTMLVAFDAAAAAGAVDFRHRAKRVQQQFWADLDHCQYSGIRVMRALMRMPDRQATSLAPVVFTSIFGTSAPAAKMLAAGDFVFGISQTPQVWLDHQVTEQAGKLVLTWDAVEGLFPAGMVSEMFDAYVELVERLAADTSSWTGTKLVRLPEDQQRVRAAANDTAGPVSTECLHALVAEAVRLDPPGVAVVGDGRRLTLDELRQSADRLAARLRAAGIRRGHPVAVVLPKGCDQVVAVLGILGAGGAYLPVDPSWPGQRIAKILEIAQTEVVVTNRDLSDSHTWPAGVRSVTVTSGIDAPEDAGECGDAPPSINGACKDDHAECTDLAYLIFTSGSTGEPKGVMTDHRGAVNTILDVNERFGVGPEDRVLALSALHFDLSVYDIFGLLAAGGTVVIPEAGATRDPRRWVELIQQERVTVWNTVPALMEMLVEHLEGRGTVLESLRLVLLSGDWIPVNLPDRVRRLAPNARVISLGGATEASIWSIHYPVEKVDPAWASIPYGKPLRNQSWHVLNDELDDCPTWVPGDLFIGGIGLALGYWKDEARTKASFVTHPGSGERLYRTGDRGRFLPDGNIEFLGRLDNQVKIRGHRIELGEIEAAIATHPQVLRVVVAAVGKDRSSRHLVGYVIPTKSDGAGDPAADLKDELRAHAAARLPAHMVPAAIVCLDTLPLTPNGKVDRDALPDPMHAQSPARAGEKPGRAAGAPSAELANRMAALIAAELGIEHVDAEANLMNLGADSVDMVRIANRIEAEFGFQPSLAEFFRNPTVAALAAAGRRSASGRGDRAVAAASSTLAAPHTPGSRLILDPAQREAFKAALPGLRRFDERQTAAALGPYDGVAQLRSIRRSQRSFADAPLDGASLGNLLSALRPLQVNGTSKYAYGSAGGLYPVQTYLHVKHGRVRGLDAGIYYHNPVDHALIPLSPGADIDPEVHEPFVNRAVFERAAFSLFLIAQLHAIEPLYAEHALRFCTIEAGLMTQLLETEAPKHGIGLCQIGWMEFDRIERHFHLDGGHRYVHSLLGGPLPDPPADPCVTVADECMSGDREEGEV